MESSIDNRGNQDKYYKSFQKNISHTTIRISQQKTVVDIKPVVECVKRIVVCDEITCIQDLIRLSEKYPIDDSIEYTNVRIKSLHKIVPYLTKLDEMIGLDSLKKSLVDQIIYYLHPIDKVNDYKHTIISGPPGTGKTEIAKLIGSIFSQLCVFGNGPVKFRQVSRSDLVAGFLGQTAIKTKEVIASCLGGVLFIDEAYSLGNANKQDAYSKECIDTLCDAMSFHKENLMVIIAGYESELNDCFFAHNQGLKSRFAWKFCIDSYNADEISRIFLTKLTNCSISSRDMSKWFSSRMHHFTSFGRDVDTFVSKIKIAHARRTFCKAGNDSITMEDIELGYEKVCLSYPPPPKKTEFSFYS